MPTKHRAEGERGLANLEGDLALLAHRETDPAVFLGDGEAEQAEVLHLLNDVGGDLVELLDRFFGRNKPVAHKAAHCADEDFEGFGVDGHGDCLPDSVSCARTKACACRGRL